MMKVEFTEWPKTTRLFRDIVISEKIDGTNSALRIERMDQVSPSGCTEYNPPIAIRDGLGLWAQSRSRLITPGDDNFGFARWVLDNAEELTTLFDTGIHFGEWWGSGIQRGYGLTKGDKRFSLFNTAAHADIHLRTALPIRAVPVLYEGVFDQGVIEENLTDLRDNGSYAAPGFMKPEGICIFHSQSRIVQKVTLDKNDAGKWES
jgi:hypothetical protein